MKYFNIDTSCTLYLDSNLGKEALVDLLEKYMESTAKSLNTLEGKYFEIDVMSNDEYDQEKKKDYKKGFLFYKYYLDVFPNENVQFEDYIIQLKLLINFLRNKSYKVVPSCEFEDELSEGKPYTEWMK